MKRIILLALVIFYSNYSFGAEKLRFIGDINYTTGEKFADTEIGGLSGLVYDKESKHILAVSDDKSQINEARFYEFELAIDTKNFSLKPVSVTKLKAPEGGYFKKNVADFEGITIYEKDVLISSEGALYLKKPIPPAFYRFSRQGEFKAMLPISPKFLPDPNNKIKLGARENKAFEALSTTLDGKTVFLATEEALFQDSPTTDISFSSTVRVSMYKDLKPVAEYAYKLEKVEALKAVDLTPGENGLVDIAAIDDQSFYSMERSYLPFLQKNIIRIFKNKITNKTTNIASIESLKDASFVSIEKELVLDLDDIIYKLNPNFQILDNIEGLAFGPVLRNGNRSLIITSDNNFGKNQRTLFIAFEIIP